MNKISNYHQLPLSSNLAWCGDSIWKTEWWVTRLTYPGDSLNYSSTYLSFWQESGTGWEMLSIPDQAQNDQVLVSCVPNWRKSKPCWNARQHLPAHASFLLLKFYYFILSILFLFSSLLFYFWPPHGIWSSWARDPSCSCHLPRSCSNCQIL